MSEYAAAPLVLMEQVDKWCGIDAVRREVGMVFQSFNLFPHLTTLQIGAPNAIRMAAQARRSAHD